MKELQLGKVKCIHGDCMDYMATLEDGAYDLCIVDPPYGINIANRNGSIGQKKGQGKITSYKYKEWDNEVPSKEYFSELFRVSKNQIIWGGNYFTNFLPSSKGWIVWDKRQPEGVSFAMAELAFSSFDISAKMFSCSRAFIGNKVSNNPKLARKYAKIHPTQKPSQLYEWLLHRYAKKGDKILDTHGGSFSHAIACHDLGFDLTIIEKDKDYFDMAVDRLKQHQRQLIIF